MTSKATFSQQITSLLNSFVNEQKNRYPANEILTIDLHCHDYNSNVPDEQLGRILGIPETWLPTQELISTLKIHGCDTFTITNHNNARSCYQLLEKGVDVLVGAEFSCTVPDYKVGIHVLTYGFTPQQEIKLNKYRNDIYKFLDYTLEQDLPTIWAHPLYHYKSKGIPPMEFFDKMALLFERFEVINGQRDSWQNMLVKQWIESLTKDKLDELSQKFKIKPDRFCKRPYDKFMSGGSDSHMGIFTGLTGVYLHIPNLNERLKTVSRSMLALEAIKQGAMAPFGSHNDSEKMAISFIDYFCQIAMNMEDPGLPHILLHKGDMQDKLAALAITNAFLELRRHKTTLNFLELFHQSLIGKTFSKTKRFYVSRDYKKVFDIAYKLSRYTKTRKKEDIEFFTESIYGIYKELLQLLMKRADKHINDFIKDERFKSKEFESFFEDIEIPTHFRKYIEPNEKSNGNGLSKVNLPKLFDELSFPFLGSAVIAAAFFTSARVMYKARPLLYEFAKVHNTLKHPERTLWLTDTFTDSNGVAMVLQSMLKEIQKRDLPIDILTISNTLQPQDHLIVIQPLKEFTLPFYEQQPLRIPDILEIHKIFKEGEYSKIIASTEGPMGLAAVWLKYAYSVPAYFYVHTDWMMFAEQTLKLTGENLNNFRRLLRTFYKGFDGLFVLNNDHRKWLTGKDMGFNPSQVFLTAHWVEEIFKPYKTSKEEIFGVSATTPVILFAGRLSEEKGVMDIPKVMEIVKQKHPHAKVAFAGIGPKEQELKKLMPDAIFLGWVDHEKLPKIYSAADMLVLPSRFDTFGCVVLEALSCGLPVLAYNTKGPKDIINNGLNGYLVKNETEMGQKIIELLDNPLLLNLFKNQSLLRAHEYSPDAIIKQFINDLNTAA
ncbi:MAG: glycosyltransferase [Spirochaetes bacterium]|nr:glycosyltransferase [Spirochaetota bacterium]